MVGKACLLAKKAFNVHWTESFLLSPPFFIFYLSLPLSSPFSLFLQTLSSPSLVLCPKFCLFFFISSLFIHPSFILCLSLSFVFSLSWLLSHCYPLSLLSDFLLYPLTLTQTRKYYFKTTLIRYIPFHLIPYAFTFNHFFPYPQKSLRSNHHGLGPLIEFLLAYICLPIASLSFFSIYISLFLI